MERSLPSVAAVQVEGGPNDLVTTDVGRTVDGALHVEPKVSAWFERLRAPYLFREVEGAPGWVDLALARVGRKVVSLYRLPGAQWQVGARYDRPDLPARLQWGVNAYTSWTSAKPRPDLKADVDFVHFYQPHIPATWIGSTDQQRSDEELVRWLAPDEPAPGQ